jgi:Flp pilus assembly protein TadG
MVSAMAICALVGPLRRRLQKLAAAERGNVVMTFALAAIPIMGFVGSAVDYSRANSAKAAMQAAVDATALMLSKTAATLTTAQIDSKATDYFNALFNRPEVTSIHITPIYTNSGGSQIVVTGTGVVPTTFMKVMGMSGLNINVSSTVKWGNVRLRVALALDNTGSMAQDGKMTALKTATKVLLSQLQGAVVNNGDVYVSIIPFSKDVNLDPANYNQTWIDWTDWDNNNGSCSKGSVNTRSQCLAQNGNPKWTSDNHNTWNGCVSDRGNSNAPNAASYDTNAAAPTTTITATLLPAEQYGSCTQPVMGLNYNWSAMTTLVNNMSPNGNTNQAIGLALSWMSLVGGGPFSAPAMDPNYQYSQVIILLTDGLNTQDRWYSDQNSIDARQQLTCSNIKAANITLYAIQVNTGGDPLSALLKNCASTPDKFFLLTSANQIVTTFNQIGTALSNLRVAK